MSMKDYSSCGYGFFISDIPISAQSIRNMISKIPDLDIELRSFDEDEDDEENFDKADIEILIENFLRNSEILKSILNDLTDDEDTIPVYAALIYGVKEAEGVNLELIRDDDNGWAVMLPRVMPWQFNDRERELTEKDLRQILYRWIEFLTDISAKINIDDIIGEIECTIFG